MAAHTASEHRLVAARRTSTTSIDSVSYLNTELTKRPEWDRWEAVVCTAQDGAVEVVHGSQVTSEEIGVALRDQLRATRARVRRRSEDGFELSKPLSWRGRLFRVIMVGDSAVGKTSLLRTLCRDSVVNVRPTMVVDLRIVYHGGHQFQMWDTAGQERFHSVVEAYYRNVHTAVIVVDLTRPGSLERVAYWTQQVSNHAPHGVRVVLVGNKADLTKERQVPPAALRARAAELQCAYSIETSAHDPAAVKTMYRRIFDWLIACPQLAANSELHSKRSLVPQSLRYGGTTQDRGCSGGGC